MSRISDRNLRFHNVVVVTILGIILSFTALILIAVIGHFNAMAEDNAKERFSLIAQTAVERLRNLVGGTGRQVMVQAGARRERFIAGGRLNDRDMVVAFMSQLDAEESLYSVYFGLDNDDFFQVVNARGNPRLLASLGAPEKTRFALRRIVGAKGAKREETWQFWSADRQILGSHRMATSYFPTRRPWYDAAKKSPPLAITDPYLFASSGEAGITISSPLRGGAGVLGADLSLGALKGFLAKIPLTPASAIVVLDRSNRILALHSASATYNLEGVTALTPLFRTANPHLSVLTGWESGGDVAKARVVDVGGEKFVFALYTYGAARGSEFKIGAFAPMREFSAPIIAARNQVLMLAVLFLLVVTPIAVVASRRAGRALVALAGDAERISNLDFTGDIGRLPTIFHEVDALGRAHQVMKDELRKRTKALTVAEQKLASLVENGILLSRERNSRALLRHILFSGRQLCHCDAGTMYLKTDHDTLKFALRTKDDLLPSLEIPLTDPATGEPNEKYVATFTALHNRTTVIDDVYAETRFDMSGSHRFDDETGYRTLSMLTVPMSPRGGEVIGVLQFMNALHPETGEVIPFPRELVGFVEALASQSAIALENFNLLEAQRALMDSLIRLLAGAIDEKSPYTGGHCERVPELALMLAEEASKVKEGPLADFGFQSEEEWREFRIGAWLHDCGKITTPEYVVDKATKLETIYNRIHEVRSRFEILRRDAEIASLKAIRAGADPAQALQEFRKQCEQLADDFAFVAKCNIGGEYMAPQQIERIRRIAGRTWLRHFDDRLGLSQDELWRYESTPAAELPAVENLLADKPWHIVPRSSDLTFDPKYGFKIKVPAHLYNFGEVLNLCVEKGTLFEEERFKINQHIIQTIIMLDALPFPKELQRVPEYAGTHHETLTGTGYPRGLTREELSVPSRIMAIADIFEALTASDRPYKKAKTLSESVRILSFFKKDGHIDPELFDLFLTSGAYLRYAERYLKPEQIDHVDVAKYVG